MLALLESMIESHEHWKLENKIEEKKTKETQNRHKISCLAVGFIETTPDLCIHNGLETLHAKECWITCY